MTKEKGGSMNSSRITFNFLKDVSKTVFPLVLTQLEVVR